MVTSWVDLAWNNARAASESPAQEPLRIALEISARRYHAARQAVGAAEHKFWKFEHCPAGACREARETMAEFDRAYGLEHNQKAAVHAGVAEAASEEVEGAGEGRTSVPPLAPEKH